MTYRLNLSSRSFLFLLSRRIPLLRGELEHVSRRSYLRSGPIRSAGCGAAGTVAVITTMKPPKASMLLELSTPAHPPARDRRRGRPDDRPKSEEMRRRWWCHGKTLTRSFPPMCMRVQHSQAPGIPHRCTAVAVSTNQPEGTEGTL